MVIRGDVHWCDHGEPSDSAPAKRRPVLVVQADDYNRSRLATTIVVALTTNTALAAMPGNVFLPASATGLPRDSTVNVTALVTLNKSDLEQSDSVGRLPDYLMDEVDSGLRLVPDL